MKLFVYFTQPLTGKVGVELGGGDVDMSKHGLDGAEVGAAFQEMGGKGVA